MDGSIDPQNRIAGESNLLLYSQPAASSIISFSNFGKPCRILHAFAGKRSSYHKLSDVFLCKLPDIGDRGGPRILGISPLDEIAHA